MPTRYNLARAALDEAIAMSHNLRQLEYHLSDMGTPSAPILSGSIGQLRARAMNARSDCTGFGEEYTKERITQRLIENRDNIDFSRSSRKPTDRSNTGSEHGATELEKSAVCMGCTFTTVTGSAICRSTRQDNRITHEFTTFSKKI